MDPAYKRLKDAKRPRIDTRYRIAGFISSGTYGKVYKATSNESGKEVAIKKFKPEKDFDPSTSAFSQSACREIAVGLSKEQRTDRTTELSDTSLKSYFFSSAENFDMKTLLDSTKSSSTR